MNRTELVGELARTTGLSREAAREAVDALFGPRSGIIAKALRRRKKVRITGFGTFEARLRSARTARNPRTGEPLRVGAMTSVAFRAGKALRETVQ